MNDIAGRIDVHHHLIPPFYREHLAAAGIAEDGGRALPEWSPHAAMMRLGGSPWSCSPKFPTWVG